MPKFKIEAELVYRIREPIFVEAEDVHEAAKAAYGAVTEEQHHIHHTLARRLAALASASEHGQAMPDEVNFLRVQEVTEG